MFSKTITYTDYDGESRTETFLFHMSEAEILELEMSVDGGFSDMINRIVAAKNVPELIKVFKDMILKAYGVKSPDARRFIKSPALSEEFSQTEAYSKFFMELATDATAAAEFVNALIPASLAKKANELTAKE